MAKLLLILGIIGMVLGGGVLLVSLLLPTLTDGRTSWEEAMLGIIPAMLIFFLSFVVALPALFAVLRKKKLWP